MFQMSNKKRNWAYSGRRWKRWSAKQGVRVATFVDQNTLLSVKSLAKKSRKAEWQILRSAINYGLSTVWRRGA
jgi:hypothetical protein